MTEMNPKFCKAARALLGWTQQELAQQAHLSSSTVADFERAERPPTPKVQAAIIESFLAHGVMPELFSFTTFLASTERHGHTRPEA